MIMEHEKVNILLVDDQPAKLLAYEVILKELGENLVVATSGRAALEILLKNEIAVILVDVCMPELDGFELAQMIREHPRFQKIAIIFISAVQVSDFDRLRGYEMGAVDYVPVPVVPAVARMVLEAADRISPIPMREYAGRHFARHEGQTLAMLDGWISAAREHEALSELADELREHNGGR